MHYTGTIWRPPYEAGSLLLQVTAGCTHHRCKFCTLYNDLAIPFRMSPVAEIAEDLQEVQNMMKGGSRHAVTRVFLTGANPFVLSYEKLETIARLIHKELPSVKSIGCFARITDISPKTDEELAQLYAMGYDGVTIGMETADDTALTFMNKGYSSSDILEQCQRLDDAGIHYHFFYLTGISGAGRGEQGAAFTAALCNRLHPVLIGANMLTIYNDSALFDEIARGNWQPESELEKYREIRTLVAQLRIETTFAAFGASNAFQMTGHLPKDQKRLLSVLDNIIETVSEEELQRYRQSVHHL
ncbi:radical SAM protein [Lachnospiraceae bacterium MD335]|nr:radical SAM protein [Lachnospiraceae bacterium MD335]